jgi:hypothetical protein
MVMAEQLIDGRIIEACQQGDRDAFQLLFETYKDTPVTATEPSPTT